MMEPYQVLLPGESAILYDNYRADSASTNIGLIKVGYVFASSRIDVYFITNISGQTMTDNVQSGVHNLIYYRNAPITSINLYAYIWVNMTYNNLPNYTIYNSVDSMFSAMDDGNWTVPTTQYPITYHYENSTVSGPSEAAVGDTVTVSAVPDNNYGITDAASQILVTNNDVAVTYQWNPSTNTITFTMPNPT